MAALEKLRLMTQRMILTPEEMVRFIIAKFSFYNLHSYVNFPLCLVGRGCFKEVLASSVLGFMRSSW